MLLLPIEKRSLLLKLLTAAMSHGLNAGAVIETTAHPESRSMLAEGAGSSRLGTRLSAGDSIASGPVSVGTEKAEKLSAEALMSASSRVFSVSVLPENWNSHRRRMVVLTTGVLKVREPLRLHPGGADMGFVITGMLWKVWLW